ncbi:type II secretion system protein [Clostridium sp. AL.422]|uniref:type IV pilus modification PilV family protein n=1 Tax=Clostridium TaxID=1485 RepID=UPI00293DD859|nr:MULTISPECIES: type II secretion system protein [unclassified Clostridium]MDV4149367.1 type II secretion system protein [Clostridium sp. AL.422]
MKGSKIKVKKGMTLIEVIISVALLSILIIPLSGLVMSSLRNNIDAEDMQKASYIGQKVLEELKAYDDITLKIDNGQKYFELLDGDKIIQMSDGKFAGSFDRTMYGKPSEVDGRDKDIYKIDVELFKDENFKYDNENNLEKNTNAAFRVNFINDSGIRKIQDSLGKVSIISNKLIIELEKSSSKLNVYGENSSSALLSIDKANVDNNDIVLYIKEDFSRDMDIEFKNNTEEIVEIRIIKGRNSYSKFKIYSSIGDVILYEENEIEENSIGDLYNYKVNVKDKKNNSLFEGASSKNVNIK